MVEFWRDRGSEIWDIEGNERERRTEAEARKRCGRPAVASPAAAEVGRFLAAGIGPVSAATGWKRKQVTTKQEQPEDDMLKTMLFWKHLLSRLSTGFAYSLSRSLFHQCSNFDFTSPIGPHLPSIQSSPIGIKLVSVLFLPST